jgi:bifunctional polynucleotide phosphatase/kinase
LDGTLIRSDVEKNPKRADNVTLMPNRREVLQEYSNRGYTIVIFTNQMAETEEEKTFKFNRVINAIKLLNIPVILFLSTGNDKYRKPNIGMWQAMLKMLSPIESSFFVGNAAGRPQDRSSADINFAGNTGIPFYTPEQIFKI